jgi:predicted ATPase
LALKDAVKRFEDGWRQTARPVIDDFLPATSSLRCEVLIELVHIDLELRLKAGETARVEEYLARFPELAADRAVALALIAAEHELRRRYESRLTLDEYFQRFPEYRDELPAHIARPTVPEGNAPPAPAHPRPEVPPAVPGYEILGLLGRGGMGVVYRARQHSLNRPVALKFLPEDCASDPVWLARFRREAVTASALNHPHICTIYDTGECAGRPFLSMELIQGRALDTLVGQHRPVNELVHWIAQAARALAAAHAAGVVHRDIKPANLMVRDDGIVKVLDFGLARRLSAPGSPAPAPAGRETDPGTMVGTLMYMSPEQARSEPAGPASDVFALGLVLYELATGQHPFLTNSAFSTLYAITFQPPLPPARLNPELPAALDALILQMLAKDPRIRPTAAEVDAALAELTENRASLPELLRPSAGRPPTVGRQQERASLWAGFESAAAGRGQLVCVTGEPGLGKTTLVEDFLDELSARGRPHGVGRGRCSERLAGAEAYLPFLEALDSLLQGAGDPTAAQTLHLLAPTWYAQLKPRAADDASLTGGPADVRGTPQERLKRELGAFLMELSRRRPTVLFLDDLQWADPSSTDLLAYLGSKCTEMQLLLVLTYRPSELLRRQHPFGPVKLDLQGRGVCREIALPYLSRDDIDRYLALTFDGHQFPREFADILHTRTEGNPLFMVDLLRYLRDCGVIVQDHGHWSLGQAVPDLGRELPESVRSMIQRKTDQLDEADRRLLMAASVQGPQFDAAVVARMLGQEPAHVEERLGALQRVHALVRLVGEQEFPDGTLTLRYRFVHTLYQNALYASLRPARKAAWSAAAAAALLDHYGEKSTAIAAELALLFEAARDYEPAADHYLAATENAIRLFAHREAVALARRGLELLALLPDTPQRGRRELRLQTTIGLQLQLTRGFAAPEVEQAYSRARELFAQVQDAAQLFPFLWGSWRFYRVRGPMKTAVELSQQLLAAAQSVSDPILLLQANQAAECTWLHCGDLTAAREYMEQAWALYDPSRYCMLVDRYAHDTGVICLGFGSLLLWLLGYPEQALKSSLQSVELAREHTHPFSLGFAYYYAAKLHQFRREAQPAQERAASVETLAAEHGFPLWLAGGIYLRGWALTQQGHHTEGLTQLRRGLADWQATGAGTHRPYQLSLVAEALGRAGQAEEGLTAIGEALALVQRNGEHYWEAELHRLRGELLLTHGEAGSSMQADAEACYHQALDVARQQQAKSLQLRAVMSLGRLYHRQGRPAEARPLLAETHGWFTEGFDTPDLREAKALLDQLG